LEAKKRKKRPIANFKQTQKWEEGERYVFSVRRKWGAENITKKVQDGKKIPLGVLGEREQRVSVTKFVNLGGFKRQKGGSGPL